MKKLIIKDHLGQVVFERDVYMEGQDFHHTEPVPFPVWVKEVYICDPDKLSEYVRIEVAEKAPEPEPEPEPEPKQDALEILARDVGVAVGEVIKEEAKLEPLPILIDRARKNFEEGLSHESETVINQSVGGKGLGETEQPESPEAVPKKPAKRKATKRSK